MKRLRYLPVAIITVVAFSSVFVGLSDKCSSKVSDINDDITESHSRYYGDTLFQYDGKTMVYDYGAFEDDDVTSVSKSAIITYRDTTPVDTCIVNGNGWYFADGEKLKFSIGVDTVYYNFKHLPKAVYSEKELLPTHVKEYSYNHTFALSDSSWNCDFAFRAYLPENPQTWTKQFIATMMRNDIQGLFMDNKGADRILKEYYGIKARPRKIYGIDASQKTPEQIARHFSEEHERLYRKDYDECGPKYDYSMLVAPAWQSKDGKYITYRFYTYYYTMGAHGFMEEYYLTFNDETGTLLGFDDLFSKSDFNKVIDALETEITEYQKDIRSFEGTYPSWLSEDELSSNATAVIKEVRDTVYYPRPALTKKGVVFSYQPYEIASFAEGIKHFVVPYSKVRFKINR